MRKLNFEQLVNDIENWLKNYLNSANLRGFILGLSGGIDSATTAALCVNAVGKENVIGFGLPCESISQDLDDAKLVAKWLKIPFHVLDLTSTYRTLVEELPANIEFNKMSIANIKPRLRMTALYSIAQTLGYLVGGTGNRTEIAIGYFTKYGDGGVDLEPIGALYKCEVRAIAKVLGIPDKIINRTPSAGLWQGQTDEGEIGLLYDEVDEILYRLDYNLELEDLNMANVEKVKKMMDSARHKAKMPPIFEVN